MAGFASDSGSEYAYDLTTSDEEVLWAIVDRLSTVSPRQSRPIQANRQTPAPPTNFATPARNAAIISSSPSSPDFDPDASLAIEETIAAITDDDLSFDISELNEHDAYGHSQGAALGHDAVSRSSSASTSSAPGWQNRKLAPSVARADRDLASFVSKTKPRSLPTLLPGPDVRYPDCKLLASPRLRRSSN
jgi:exonuclease V